MNKTNNFTLIFSKLVTTLLILLVSTPIYSWQDPKVSLPQSFNLLSRAANCTPSTGRKFLEFNNVSALIETGGSMWLDRSRGKNAYEVPKGSGNTLIYIGALWMGGMDVNNQLKIAALRYRSGNDFWAGPLSSNPGTGDISNGILDYGPAEIVAEDCDKWDQFFITQRSEVELFNAWFECTNDPDCDASFDYPDYQIPASILEWGNATHGDISKNQDFYIAPYYERPSGNIGYDPVNDGDYPWYDLSNQIDCRTSRRVTLYGDYNMWWVFNDKGNIHTETGGDPIGMEIRAQAFAFATNDEVNSMTFYNYEL